MTNWVGLLYIKDKKILMVREVDKDFFVLPGGRLEPGESEDQALRREVSEELGIHIKNYKYFNKFELPGRAEGELINFAVYTIDSLGDLTVQGDIAEMAWVDSSYESKGIKIGAITQVLIPKLKEQNLIS